MAEKALEKWSQQLDESGFLSRMDMLREMASVVARQWAGQEEDPELAMLGKNWITGFLDFYLQVVAKFGTQTDRQTVFTNNPITLRDYYTKLQRLLIFDIGTKKDSSLAFPLGEKKIICHAVRCNLPVAQDVSQEMLTVLETVSVLGFVLPPFVVYKGKCHYMGWHLETDNPKAQFAYSKNGSTNNELGVAWLSKDFESKTDTKHSRLLIHEGHG
ncbi:hypothetical protein C7212DRAFT_216621 [Tuber magnatum]|uniref:HTH CENPB-type domain-containing protein n=1 Tax=Tuber magnatum TaxID=42249 RepID=A0A317SIS2_9PEZI|nr:hypothetical protein C7212DRAFT_216621 [Tuber magnatum]